MPKTSKKPSNKKTYKKYSPKKRTLKKEVKYIKRTLRRIQPETKHYDVNESSAVVDNNPTFGLLPYRGITLGTSDFANRIGDEIRVKFFQFRCTLYKVSGTTTTPARVRVGAFIYKRNPDTIGLAFSTIINLYLVSGTMNGGNAPMAFRDWDNASSFHTLHDKSYIFNLNDVIDKQMMVDFTVRLPDKYATVQYHSAGSLPAKNELIVYMIQSQDVGMLADYQYRMSYTDA